jgi:hypothetical protein
MRSQREDAQSKERPKNNFAVLFPLTLPSPARGEGLETEVIFPPLLRFHGRWHEIAEPYPNASIRGVSITAVDSSRSALRLDRFIIAANRSTLFGGSRSHPRLSNCLKL